MCHVREAHLRRKRKRQICARADARLFRFLLFYFIFFLFFGELRDLLLKVVNRAIPCTQVSRLDILAERGRQDIGIVNHVRGQVYGSSDTAIAYRSVPFQGCEEKELKGKRGTKKKERFIARARLAKKNLAIPLLGYLRLEPIPFSFFAN